MPRRPPLSALCLLWACGGATEPREIAPPTPDEIPDPVELAPAREAAAPQERAATAELTERRVAVVTQAYASYAGDGLPAQLGGAPTTPELGEALEGLHFDPALDAQDFGGVRVISAAPEGDTVVVTFENFGAQKTLIWVFQEDKVKDIRSADGRSLIRH